MLFLKSLLPFSLLFILGCSTTHPSLSTVERVDLDKYMGTWYEIARYEHRFEKGCSDVSATYTKREDGKIDVLNRCMKEEGLSEANGVAYAVNDTNSQLKVTFFWPFYGDYWVMMLDEDYTYAVIGDPSREYLWILSRSKTLDPQIKKKILEKLPSLGYEIEPLIWTKQS